MCLNINGKISIIIPIYNAQEYIEKCIDSILIQTYENFEVICVNDGSKDGSGDICERYKKKDGRVRVFHIENHGVSYARNYGLSLAKGEWFCFVDADDWVEPIYLERMYRLAIERGCDVVACGIDKTWEYVMGVKDCIEDIFEFGSSKECICNFICDSNSMQGVSWNKLYNSSKFKEIKFCENLKVNEDCMFVYEIMSRCDKACLTTLPLYHWYIRKNSACHKRAKVVDFSAANVFLRLFENVLEIADEETLKVLRRNYVVNVVQVLLYAKYEKDNDEVIDVKNRCKKWKKDVWKMLEIKQKLKFWYAIYCK